MNGSPAIPLLNFLPYRAARRARQQRRFAIWLAASALAGGACAGLAGVACSLDAEARAQQNRIQRQALVRLDADIARARQLEQATRALVASTAALQSLDAGRDHLLHLLDALAASVPDGVGLTRLQPARDSLEITGRARSPDAVSQFMHALNKNTVFATSTLVTLRRVRGSTQFDFTLRVPLARPPVA